MGFDEEHPLATIVESMLERTHPDYKETPDIKWNFTKFLVDREGEVAARYEPTASIQEIETCIKKLLQLPTP